MTLYVRDLEDGTEQIVDFEDDPGKSIPQWRLVAPKTKTRKPRKQKAGE